MRLLLVSFNLYPCKTGGAEVFNYYLINALSEKNKIIVLTNCKKLNENENITVKYIRNVRPRSLLVPLQIMIKIISLKKWIEIIHISYMRTNWKHWVIYPLINSIFGINYIITIHGGALTPWKPQWPHNLLFKKALHITSASERVKEEYEKRSNREIIFTPPLIPFKVSEKNKNDIKKEYGLKNNHKVILYVGSIKPIKGTKILLEGYTALGKNYIESNNLMLLIAGDGVDRRKLENEYLNSIFNNYLRFLGRIKNELIKDLYKIADIYVITSYFENTPISMLEAMYNTLPIIGSDVPGINNILENGENGLLFESKNASDLTQKMKMLVENSELRSNIKLNAKMYFNKFYNYDGLLNIFYNLFGSK